MNNFIKLLLLKLKILLLDLGVKNVKLFSFYEYSLLGGKEFMY